MNNIKKARCPHCKGINTVDISSELEKHETITYKTLFPDKPNNKNIPKSIEIICTHCNKPFKINI